ALKQANAKWTTDGPVEVAFAAVKAEAELNHLKEIIQQATTAGAGAGHPIAASAFFTMFMPGQSPLLDQLLTLSQSPTSYVRGVVSTVNESAHGITSFHGQVIRNGEDPKSFEDKTLLPNGVPGHNTPAWAKEEFQRKLIFEAGMFAIVHSKV